MVKKTVYLKVQIVLFFSEAFIIKLLKRREILLLLSKNVCLSVGPE